MSHELRVVVVGTGFGARVVAPAYDATEGLRVQEVVSARDAAGVAAACARSDVDLVSIHSPPFLHREHVQRALERGRAVLCDKPFGRSGAEAEAMAASAVAAGVVHAVNFEFRTDPARAALRDLVRSGAIGTVEHVGWTHWSAGSRVPLRGYGWLFERSRGGGWLGAWGSHAIDALRWTFGEIGGATARCRTVIASRPDATGVPRVCDAEDAFVAWLDLASGVTVAIDSSFAAPVTIAPRLVVHGTEGSVECIADARLTVRREGGEREQIALAPADGDPHVAPMLRQAELIRDAVRSGSAPDGLATFADGLACARVLDQLRRG